MNQNLIYFPCLAMLLLSAIVLVRMFLTRVMAVKKGAVDYRYFKTYGETKDLPLPMLQASRNFSNLFEVPTLFYMVCAFALITQNVESLFLTMAWIYVGLRYIHSAIHLTNNKMIPRMSTYALSWMVLLAMGISLGYKVFLSL